MGFKEAESRRLTVPTASIGVCCASSSKPGGVKVGVRTGMVKFKGTKVVHEA